MATINNTIKLTDRMTGPLHSITSALNSTLDALESMKGSMGKSFDTSKIDSARKSIESANASIINLGDHIEEAENKQKQFNSTINAGTSAIGKLVGAFAGITGIKKLAGLSDTFTQTRARLDLMNDGLQTTKELEDKIFASAQRSRASYQETADMVSKLGSQAKGAFKNNDELIAFAEQLNKNFALAGTSQQGIASAQLQLTQALASGVLRGEELNAVFENATPVIQKIADYLEVDIGQIRKLAGEGKLSAQIVKNALLASADETNKAFESMPMTWGQVWTNICNRVYKISQPILQIINKIANNWEIIEPIVLGIAGAIGIYTAALITYNAIKGISATVEAVHAASMMMATGATFAATSAQYGFNAALMACPLTWILFAIIAIIAIIYAVVAAINKAKGTTISATGVIVGTLFTAGAIIWNIFLMLIDFILGGISILGNAWLTFSGFLKNLFNDPIASIIKLFGGLGDSVLGILETIAKGIDKVFGSNLSGAIKGWRKNLQGKVDELAYKYGNGTYRDEREKFNLSAESLGLKRWSYNSAYNKGYSLGQKVDSKMGDLFGGNSSVLDNISKGIDGIGKDTSSISDSMDITSEDLKYLRDIAEQEAINRFTTAEIKIDMGGITNNVSNNTDLDGLIDYVANELQIAVEDVARGV